MFLGMPFTTDLQQATRVRQIFRCLSCCKPTSVDVGGRLESRRGFDSLQPHTLGDKKSIHLGSIGPLTPPLTFAVAPPGKGAWVLAHPRNPSSRTISGTLLTAPTFFASLSLSRADTEVAKRGRL